MDYYGCEFLDLENYVAPIKKHQTLPMSLIEKLVDKKEIAEKEKNASETINQLVNSIRLNGQLSPGKIVIGPNGVTLEDGNHRYIACKILQIKEYYAIIEIGEKPIKKGGISMQVFVKMLLEHIYEVE